MGDGLPHRSLNAEFNEDGYSLVQRDIELLIMAVNQLAARTGQPIGAERGPAQATDIGSQTVPAIQPDPVVVTGTARVGQVPKYNGKDWTPGDLAAVTVAYLGTLDVPIFGGSVTAAGTGWGAYTVDWQQYRTASTQVAGGIGSGILAGYRNTAASNLAVVIGGDSNSITGAGNASLAFGTANVITGPTGCIAIGGSNTLSGAVAGGCLAIGSSNTLHGTSVGVIGSSNVIHSSSYGLALGNGNYFGTVSADISAPAYVLGASNTIGYTTGASSPAGGPTSVGGTNCHSSGWISAGGSGALIGYGNEITATPCSATLPVILGVNNTLSSAPLYYNVMLVGVDLSGTIDSAVTIGRGASATGAAMSGPGSLGVTLVGGADCQGDLYVSQNKDIYINAAHGVYVGGTKVLSGQGASVSTVTGAFGTWENAAQTAINAIISRLQAHGLIA